jgi:hypothetical protein
MVPGRNRNGRLIGAQLRGREIAFKLEKFRMRRQHAGKFLQRLAHLHRRSGDAGKDQKHCENDRRLHVEEHETDKGDQGADKSGNDGYGETIAVLLTTIRQLLAREPGETVLKFSEETGLAVLSGSELQTAEELCRLVHECNAGAAELLAELVGPAQHYQTYSRADGDQKKRQGGQQRRQQKRDGDLSENDDHRRSEMQHTVRCGADPVNVAAHQMRDAGVLQARDHRPGRGGEPPSEAGADRFDETGLELRQRHVAAGNGDRPDDDQYGENAEQHRQARAARLYAKYVEPLRDESVRPTCAGVRCGDDRQERHEEQKTDAVERRGDHAERRCPDAVEAGKRREVFDE